MRAFIYTGGWVNLQNITEHPKGDDITIAADSGYNTALALGEKVNILLVYVTFFIYLCGCV